jgi:hypothetical protein
MSAEAVRRLALALPGAVEADHHGIPSFRVGGKIFCTLRPAEGRMMVKLDPEDQHNLCQGHPDCIAPVPGYWGRKGASFVTLETAPHSLVKELLRMAWGEVAPARRRPSA